MTRSAEKNHVRLPAAVSGILWALLGTLAFSLILAFGKLVGVDSKIPALQIVFLRYIGGLAAMLLILSRYPMLRKEMPGVAGVKSHFMRALCGSLGVVCSLYAVTHMPLADATAIGLTQGLLVVVLAYIFLRERVTGMQWAAGVVCALGALIVVFGRDGFRLPSAAYLWPSAAGFAGALLIAAEMVLIRTLALRDTPAAVLFYVNVLASALLLAPALALWHPIKLAEALLLLLLGPLAIAAQYFNIRAYKLAGASLLGPVGYSRLLFAAMIGFLMFGEVPALTTWIGGAIILIGGSALTLTHLSLRR